MNPAQLIENRPVLTIFRDCLKLAGRMVNDPVRVVAVRKLIKHQFFKNKDVFDQQQIRSLKLNAVRGISNYIIYTVKQQYKIPNPHLNVLHEHEEEPHDQHQK